MMTNLSPTSEQLPPRRRLVLAVCGLLTLAVIVVFAQTVRFDFVNFDDPGYVSTNRWVVAGLTRPGIAWAFTTTQMANWHPLTWLSHMADCQFYGLWPGGHHLTSVALHAATVVLLFLVLREMTGALGPSAFAACLFAIHPLRAESVAWVAERKDVLSGFFFMLTLAAYVRYARAPFSLPRYLTVLALFACGLMAKAMLVTLPCVLLLIDWWPLGRFVHSCQDEPQDAAGAAHAGATSRSLNLQTLWEKIPLFVLAAAACWVTILAQRETITENAPILPSMRIGNALVAYMAYVGQFFLPVDLAAFYPHPTNGLPSWKVAGSLAALPAISILAFLRRRQQPYLLFGWLWFLGMLVPVIGIVQVGGQGMADRYTYLPQIGLCVALAWGAADCAKFWSVPRRIQAIVAVLIVAMLMAVCWRQTTFWKSREILWRRAIACTKENWMAEYNLALVLYQQGKTEEATLRFEKLLAMRQTGKPALDAHNYLGNILASQGWSDEAMAHFKKALDLQPNDAVAHNNLGIELDKQGRNVEAMNHYRQVLEIRPEFAPAHYNLANDLMGQGKPDEAIAHFQETLRISPDMPTARLNLVDALAAQGKLDAAIAACRQGIAVAENRNNKELADALREKLNRCQDAARQGP